MVSDPESTVRLSILHCFHADFDRHLARSHHIEALLFLLSDENNEIIADSAVTRSFSHVQPRCFAPLLLLMRLISETKNSGDNKLKEEATLLLCTFLRATSLQTIIRPFMSVLISSLPVGINVKSSDVRLMTAGLEALGELCKVMEVDVLPFADQLLPIIIANMSDYGTMKKQEMATRTLGQLVRHRPGSNPVPSVPGLAPHGLSTSPPVPICPGRYVESLRTLGLLEPLSPAQVNITYLQQREARQKALLAGDNTTVADKLMGNAGWRGPGSVTTATTTATSGLGLDSVLQNLRAAATAEEGSEFGKDGGETDGKGKRVDLSNNKKTFSSVMVTELLDDERAAERPAHHFMYEQSAMRSLSEPLVQEAQRPNPSDQDYYPQVAVSVLMKILKDNSQSADHSSVTQAILLIFKSLGMACVPLMDGSCPICWSLFATATLVCANPCSSSWHS